MEKCRVDDNVSSSDRTSHGVASSTGENKTSTQSQRDTEISTISSERVQSTQQTFIRGNVNSENMQPLNKGIKSPVADRTEEVSQTYPTTNVSSHYEQFKIESLSSEESGEAIGISSVDSADPKLCQSSNEKSIIRPDTCVYSHATQSDESRNVQDPESSHMATITNPIAPREHSLHHCKFDLNEDMEADGLECPQHTLQELNSSVRGVPVSQPIPVMAKVGVPIGLPPKPLQFGGDLGWRRSVTTSAFRPTFFRNFYREKGDRGNLSDCGSRQSLVSLGIDLNVAPTVDSELPADETSVDVSSKQPERFLLDLNCPSEINEDHHKPRSSGFNLNDNYVIEDTATCSRGNGKKPSFDCRMPSYLVNLSSVQGFSHVQAQPLLVAAPTAEGMRMMVPAQSGISFFPHATSGLHMGKTNSLSPTFYPTSVLPHLNNQHGPVLAAYPRTMHVLQNPQGLNPNVYANLPPTFIQNDSVALMENGSWGASNAEFFIPARSTLVEERMKPMEQLAFPASYAKRKEPDGGWDSSQINSRWMAPWS